MPLVVPSTPGWQVPKSVARYLSPVPANNVSSGAPPGLNGIGFSPVWLPAGVIDRLGIWITAAAGAGGVARIGIWRPDSNGLPGALIGATGTIDITGTGFKEATVSIAIPGGLVFLGAVMQVSAGSWVYHQQLNMHMLSETPATVNAQFGYSNSGVTGALPDPAVIDGIHSGAGSVPRIWVRYSS